VDKRATGCKTQQLSLCVCFVGNLPRCLKLTTVCSWGSDTLFHINWNAMLFYAAFLSSNMTPQTGWLMHLEQLTELGPPLWSSGQSSWLQIQRSGFDSPHCQIFWEVVGLERGPLSLVSTIEELLERKSSVSGLENREYGRRDPSRLSRGTLYPQKLALTSPASGGRSVGIVRSRTLATEFFLAPLQDRYAQ
jgi:hypothetical protein